MRTLTATKRASCVSSTVLSTSVTLTHYTRLSFSLFVFERPVATASPDALASDTNTNPAATGRPTDPPAPTPTPRGMQELQAMDNSHVALVAVKLLADGFRQYRCVSSRMFIFRICGAALCSVRALPRLASSLCQEANACHGHC